MTTFTLRDGTRIRFGPPYPEDGRHPFQVLLPNGQGGTSGSGKDRAEAEQMANEVLREGGGP